MLSKQLKNSIKEITKQQTMTQKQTFTPRSVSKTTYFFSKSANTFLTSKTFGLSIVLPIFVSLLFWLAKFDVEMQKMSFHQLKQFEQEWFGDWLELNQYKGWEYFTNTISGAFENSQNEPKRDKVNDLTKKKSIETNQQPYINAPFTSFPKCTWSDQDNYTFPYWNNTKFMQSIKILNKYNVAYFITDGTLLGAFRHGGPIPCDGDIDIVFPVWLVFIFCFSF